MLLLNLSNCGPLEVLRVLYFCKLILEIVFIIIPIALIIYIMIDLSKAVISGNESEQKKIFNLTIKRILYAIIVFFVPTIVSIFNSIIGDLGFDYSVCLNNITKENMDELNSIEFSCNEAEKYVAIAEKELSEEAFKKAQEYIDATMDLEVRRKLQNRLDKAKEFAKNLAEKKEDESSDDNEEPSIDTEYESTVSNGYCVISNTIIELSSEPDPSCIMKYLGEKNYIYEKNFIYPTKNGLYLGAWPKNYADIPTNLSNPKTYSNGKLIWPVTPVNGKYTFVYEHNGIDIMAYMGTPIYSPVDGQLVYSEWGHTSNKGSDETAYSITITMDNPIVYNEVSYDSIFLTHMSGIVNRCSQGACNKTVSKGELIGYIGTAAGDSLEPGFAPHLHMTIRQTGKQQGLTTSDIQSIYNLSCKSSCKDIKIKAGE